MKKKTEQKILTIIIVLALVALAVLVSSIVYEEEMRKNKKAVESTATPIIENKDTDVEETTEKEENLPQEPAKEEYVGEEEKEAEQENVANQAQSKDEKAIELAKKEWGKDNSVTFNIEEKDGDKYYVAVKKDATAIKWYEVDTTNWSISEY